MSLPAVLDVPVSSLNFSRNCTIAGNAQSALTATGWNGGPRMDHVLWFVRSAFPPEYGELPFSDVAKYIENQVAAGVWPPGFMVTGPFYDPAIVEDVVNVCHTRMCELIFSYFPGNPDITGIGMIASYGLQAGLLTLLGTAHLLFPRSEIVGDTLLTFLDASTIFSFSLAIATLSTASKLKTSYEARAALMAPCAASSTVFPIFNLLRRRLRRWIWRLMSIWLCILFTDAAVVLLRTRLFAEDMMDNGCADFSGEAMVTFPRAVTAWAVLEGMTVIGTVLLPVLMKFWGGMEWWWVRGVLVAHVIIMWVLIGMLVDSRKKVEAVAEQTFSEVQWGYGQVLSVFVWAPVAVEFIYLWKSKLEDALEGRMLSPATVVVEEEGLEVKEEQTSSTEESEEAAEAAESPAGDDAETGQTEDSPANSNEDAEADPTPPAAEQQDPDSIAIIETRAPEIQQDPESQVQETTHTPPSGVLDTFSYMMRTIRRFGPMYDWKPERERPGIRKDLPSG